MSLVESLLTTGKENTKKLESMEKTLTAIFAQDKKAEGDRKKERREDQQSRARLAGDNSIKKQLAVIEKGQKKTDEANGLLSSLLGAVLPLASLLNLGDQIIKGVGDAIKNLNPFKQKPTPRPTQAPSGAKGGTKPRPNRGSGAKNRPVKPKPQASSGGKTSPSKSSGGKTSPSRGSGAKNKPASVKAPTAPKPSIPKPKATLADKVTRVVKGGVKGVARGGATVGISVLADYLLDKGFDKIEQAQIKGAVEKYVASDKEERVKMLTKLRTLHKEKKDYIEEGSAAYWAEKTFALGGETPTEKQYGFLDNLLKAIEFMDDQAKNIGVQKKQKGGPINVPGTGSGDKVPMMLKPGSFVLNRNASNVLRRQEGGDVPALLEPGEMVFPKTTKRLTKLNKDIPRFQKGGETTESETESESKFVIPLTKGRVGTGPAQVFGAPRDGGSRRHSGVDLVENAPWGSDPKLPVVSAKDGIVLPEKYTSSGYVAGLIVSQTDGIDSRYVHMTPEVRPGDQVKAGDRIGKLIDLKDQSHLHYEIYKKGSSGALNPTPYLNSAGKPPSGGATIPGMTKEPDGKKGTETGLARGEGSKEANKPGTTTSTSGANPPTGKPEEKDKDAGNLISNSIRAIKESLIGAAQFAGVDTSEIEKIFASEASKNKERYNLSDDLTQVSGGSTAPAEAITPAVPTTVRQKAILAAGTNDFEDPDRAARNVSEMITSLQSKNYDVVFVAPNNMMELAEVHQRTVEVAREKKAEVVTPVDFDDMGHVMTLDQAQKIRQQYPNAIVVGDKNAVRIAGNEEGNLRGEVRTENNLEAIKSLKSGKETVEQIKSDVESKVPAEALSPESKGQAATPASGGGGAYGEQTLLEHAKANGIQGVELAQFMAQMGHESGSFKYKTEIASGEAYNPGTSTGKVLGNTQPGDGPRFKGRGYVQLTGRWNYGHYGKMVGKDLVSDPDLAADDQVALDIAMAYWKDRVKSRVSNFNDTKAVTLAINGGVNGLQDRMDRFSKWQGKVQGSQTGGAVEALKSGGMVPTMLEPGELVFPPGQWDKGIEGLNQAIPRFQTGGAVGIKGRSNPNKMLQEFTLKKEEEKKQDMMRSTQTIINAPSQQAPQQSSAGDVPQVPFMPGPSVNFLSDVINRTSLGGVYS